LPTHPATQSAQTYLLIYLQRTFNVLPSTTCALSINSQPISSLFRSILPSSPLCQNLRFTSQFRRYINLCVYIYTYLLIYHTERPNYVDVDKHSIGGQGCVASCCPCVRPSTVWRLVHFRLARWRAGRVRPRHCLTGLTAASAVMERSGLVELRRLKLLSRQKHNF